MGLFGDSKADKAHAARVDAAMALQRAARKAADEREAHRKARDDAAAQEKRRREAEYDRIRKEHAAAIKKARRK